MVTVLVMLLVGRKANAVKKFSGLSLTWRTVAAGALVPIGVAILSIPSSLFGGEDPNTSAQAIVFSLELIVVAVIAVPVLIQQWSRCRRDGAVATLPNEFVRIFGPIFLAVLAVLWGSALPEYFDARHGITADGTPVGNLAYALASFVLAALAVYSVSTTARTKQVAPEGDHALR